MMLKQHVTQNRMRYDSSQAFTGSVFQGQNQPLNRYLQDLPNNSTLLVTYVDRLFRNTRQAGKVMTSFRKRGINVIATEDKVDTSPRCLPKFFAKVRLAQAISELQSRKTKRIQELAKFQKPCDRRGLKATVIAKKIVRVLH
jgi:DNA invertase Pin-like site-specific DNA recombinase